ncbi:CU044_5270 family protein [Nonomuraea sp. NPDC049028]|uniref:CU044_5270 family protein n=1 Tax=Nonomuraea sp. NPDC049028 TaxID=3364348 RepID=UPI003720E27E
MDDLNLLQGLRADAPEPDAARLAALRDRLTSATTATVSPPERRRLWRPLARRALLAGTLAAGLVVALTFAGPAHESRPTRPAPSMRPGSLLLLEQAATAVENKTSSTPRPDQWVYTMSKVVQPGDGRVTTQESWFRYDGKQRADFLDGELKVSDVPPDPDDDDLSPQKYHDRLTALPTEPDKLLAKVSRDRHWSDLPKEDPGAGEPADDRAYRVLSVYLEQQAVMPPKLEAAIFRAMARIPGVKIAVDVPDAEDRLGIGVYYEPKGQQVTTEYLVLDPATYHLLGRRTIWNRDEWITMPGKAPEPAFEAGSFWASAELRSGIVDKPGQIP